MEKDFVIFAYTRREALADGVLVDVTETAKEVGFVLPVAVSQRVWGLCVAVPGHTKHKAEYARLLYLVSMLYFAVKEGIRGDSAVSFELGVQNRVGQPTDFYTLRAVCGPDDDGKPCLTVMLPDED